MTRTFTRVSSRREAALLLASLCLSLLPAVRLAAQTAATHVPARLVVTLGSWVPATVKKRKGPPGFDLGFRLVGPRFDGAFALGGVPHEVPEGEAFEARVQLANIGRKAIRVDKVTVAGEGLNLETRLLASSVAARTSVDVASFRVPPQPFSGSIYRITVTLRNGDRHTATLTIAPR